MHCGIIWTSFPQTKIHNGTQQTISMHCGIHHASSHHCAGSPITHVQWHSAHYLDAPWHPVPIHNRIHCAEQRWHLTCSHHSLWQRTGLLQAGIHNGSQHTHSMHCGIQHANSLQSGSEQTYIRHI